MITDFIIKPEDKTLKEFLGQMDRNEAMYFRWFLRNEIDNPRAAQHAAYLRYLMSVVDDVLLKEQP